jgi:hypothetical protein
VGKGGASSSLAAGKKVAVKVPPKPKPLAAKVAAVARDEKKGTEFRRFYDRGDLPLQVPPLRNVAHAC